MIEQKGCCYWFDSTLCCCWLHFLLCDTRSDSDFPLCLLPSFLWSLYCFKVSVVVVEDQNHKTKFALEEQLSESFLSTLILVPEELIYQDSRTFQTPFEEISLTKIFLRQLFVKLPNRSLDSQNTYLAFRRVFETQIYRKRDCQRVREERKGRSRDSTPRRVA